MSVIDVGRRTISTIGKLLKAEVNLFRALLDGDLNQRDLDAFIEFGRLAFESQDLVQDIVKYQAMLAASIALSKILAWIDAGGLAPLLNSEIARFLAPAMGAINTVVARVQKEEERIRGIIDQAAVEQAVRNIRRFHTVATIISPRYRAEIASWNDSVRDLSREVFGEVSTLNSGLALVQMAVYDLTDAQGEPVNIAQNKYFDKAFQVTEEVERRSRHYARNPGDFWFYLNNNVIDGLFSERVYITSRMDKRLGDVTEILTRADKKLTRVSDRFDDYREELEPFLSQEKLIEIDKIRRDFNKDIRTPLGNLTTFFEEEFPKIEDELLAIDIQATATANSLKEAEIATTDPARLSESGQARQRDRYQSIFKNIMALGESGYTNLNLAMERQGSLYKEITGQ